MASSSVLKGLVALVTGGASGLGEAAARRLVRDGASVVICDLPSSNGKRIAEDIGEKCVFSATDVTCEADVQSALRLVSTKFKKLNVIVNCAGISKKTYEAKTDSIITPEDYMKTVMVNTIGTFNVVRLAVGLMGRNHPDEDGQKGVIINTASIPSFDGQQGQVDYAASKGGVVGMTLPLARDLECQGIRCYAIAPGPFDTSLHQKLPEKDHTKLSETDPFPIKLVRPDDYASLVHDLIKNPYMNGSVIRLHGTSVTQP